MRVAWSRSPSTPGRRHRTSGSRAIAIAEDNGRLVHGDFLETDLVLDRL